MIYLSNSAHNLFCIFEYYPYKKLKLLTIIFASISLKFFIDTFFFCINFIVFISIKYLDLNKK